MAAVECTATAAEPLQRYSCRPSVPLVAQCIRMAQYCVVCSVGRTTINHRKVARTAAPPDHQRLVVIGALCTSQVEAPPVDPEEYAELRREYNQHRAMGDIREPYRIPNDYMLATKRVHTSPLPDAPLIVFINSRSGGRAGVRLTQVLCHAVGSAQVCAIEPF